MLTQSVPFGMYGLGQMTGWPQYPVPPQLLQAYPQDPYGILARTGWQAAQAVHAAQAANPWVIQALLGELVGAIVRQGQVGLGHAGIGHGVLGGLPLGGLPYAGHGFGVQPFIGQPFGANPFLGQTIGSPLQTMIGGAFTPQGSYGNGTIGAGLPFPTAVGSWSVPAMAMV